MTALLIAAGVALASLGVALFVARVIHASHTPSSLGSSVAPRAEGTGAHPGEVGHSVSPRAVGSPRDASRPGLICVYWQEGRPCRELPDLERDLWCPACLAADAPTLGGEQR